MIHTHILTPILEAMLMIRFLIFFFICQDEPGEDSVQDPGQARFYNSSVELAKAGPRKRLHEHMEVEPYSQSHLNKLPWN